MDDGKGYYISGLANGDQQVEIFLVYGKPSTERSALASTVQAVERGFILRKMYDVPNTVSILVTQINNKPVKVSAIGWQSFANEQNLQRVFDLYSLQWLREMGEYSRRIEFRRGIAKVLETENPDEVRKYLDQGEQVDVELPKVRVEGLEDILNQVAASISPIRA